MRPRSSSPKLAASEIDLEAHAEHQCVIHRHQPRMQHLQVRREVAARLIRAEPIRTPRKG